MAKKNKPKYEWKLIFDYMEDFKFKPYSHTQFEEAFWHLWTLNCYHVTMSFDVNMVLLLDWALVYHMGLKK